MVAAGISLRVIQEIGGWSTLRMLERYAHPSGAEMSRAVRVLTPYTTGTKTGTATENEKPDQKKADATSVAESEVMKWRPQREPGHYRRPPYVVLSAGRRSGSRARFQEPGARLGGVSGPIGRRRWGYFFFFFFFFVVFLLSDSIRS